MKKYMFALAFSMLGMFGYAQEGIDVTGKVVRYVEADEMIVSSSITAVEDNVQDAFKVGTEKSRAVLAYLASLEDVCEVETQQVRLHEQFEYNSGRRVRKGFVAQQRISIRIKDFDRYPDIMEKLIELGVDELSNVQFVYTKEAEVREELRLEAIRVARAKAEVVAGALGVELGVAQSYSEGGYTPPVLANMEYKAMSDMDGTMDGPAISPAKSKIEMEVHVRFAILAPQN